jgi:hypothetical protein
VSTAGAGRHDVVVDQHVECREEGVQIVRHRLIMDALLPCPDTGIPSHDLHRINHLMRLRLGPPRWWVRTSMINLVLAKLPQVPAVMIDRPPPPAAPMSGHHRGRPCHLNVAGQTHVCKSWSGQTQR